MKKEEKVEDKWSDFPPKIQTIIREIENDSEKYEWEQKSLDLLIHPGKPDKKNRILTLRRTKLTEARNDGRGLVRY